MKRDQVTYCFIRDDLPAVQKVVQVGHVMDAAGDKFGHKKKRHLVVLGVENQEKLIEAIAHMEVNGVKHVTYIDGDIDGLTASASQPMRSLKKRHLFKDFKLLKL